MQDEFKAVHVLTLQTGTPSYLQTAKKQVKVMEDLKGMKIQSSGGPQIDVLKYLGAVPMATASSDEYMNLQKGVIDGASSNWDFVISFRIYEVAKYYTYLALNTARFSIIMNQDRWKSLPPDIQNVFNTKGGQWGSEFWGYNMFDSIADAAKPMILKAGFPMEEYTLPAAEVQRWSDVAGKPVWDAWIKKNKDGGHPEAQDILNTFLDSAKTFKPNTYNP
jgi:TRAP-type transport system periplasmic protein